MPGEIRKRPTGYYNIVTVFTVIDKRFVTVSAQVISTGILTASRLHHPGFSQPDNDDVMGFC